MLSKQQQKIVAICHEEYKYPYPDTHIWNRKLFEAIRECYAGSISEFHFSEQLSSLANIIREQDKMIVQHKEKK